MAIRTGLQPIITIKDPVNENVLGREDLPQGEFRWTPKRKAIVLEALKAGMITEAEAYAMYRFTVREFEAMKALYAARGMEGLSVEEESIATLNRHTSIRELHEKIEVNGYELNLKSNTFRAKGGLKVRLRGREAQLLGLLMAYPNTLISREDCLVELYDLVGKKRPASKALLVHVHKVRAKIAPTIKDTQVKLETQWGRGYCLKI